VRHRLDDPFLGDYAALAGQSTMTLEIQLRAEPARYRAGDAVTLAATYLNTGESTLALTFWWNRTMRVVDASDRVVAAGPGPVLPCGVGEEQTLLEPGGRFDRPEPLGCTQPAGARERIGWSYALAAGVYRITLIFEAPPAHGFTQSRGDTRAHVGRVESNEVTVTIEPRTGWLARLLG
jgi:hypothetical protein